MANKKKAVGGGKKPAKRAKTDANAPNETLDPLAIAAASLAAMDEGMLEDDDTGEYELETEEATHERIWKDLMARDQPVDKPTSPLPKSGTAAPTAQASQHEPPVSSAKPSPAPSPAPGRLTPSTTRPTSSSISSQLQHTPNVDTRLRQASLQAAHIMTLLQRLLADPTVASHQTLDLNMLVEHVVKQSRIEGDQLLPLQVIFSQITRAHERVAATAAASSHANTQAPAA